MESKLHMLLVDPKTLEPSAPNWSIPNLKGQIPTISIESLLPFSFDAELNAGVATSNQQPQDAGVDCNHKEKVSSLKRPATKKQKMRLKSQTKANPPLYARNKDEITDIDPKSLKKSIRSRNYREKQKEEKTQMKKFVNELKQQLDEERNKNINLENIVADMKIRIFELEQQMKDNDEKAANLIKPIYFSGLQQPEEVPTNWEDAESPTNLKDPDMDTIWEGQEFSSDLGFERLLDEYMIIANSEDYVTELDLNLITEYLDKDEKQMEE